MSEALVSRTGHLEAMASNAFSFVIYASGNGRSTT